ncbi:MAG: winged helix DNA-binding domain-containing protein [Actinomycetota bacterium]|nr:winged helix DNA-binding domain-containing protein [Actinomycetota bacterium]
MGLTWAKARGWRLQRQMLDPVGSGSVEDVVARLGAVPAWPDMAAELVIGARRQHGHYGDAARALAAGNLVKVFAFRGATHLMAPRDAGAYLAVRASSRMWELPSWESYYGLAPSDWPGFREFVRQALDDGPLTRSELAGALGRSRRYRHLRAAVTEGNDTLLKPLTWQGDMGLGPVRDGETTFVRLDAVRGWAGIPDLDEAGPTVVAAYLRTYGPAPPDRLYDWFCKGLGAKRQALTRWLDHLDDQCEVVAVADDRVLVLRDDLDALRSASASSAVRLLPGRDPWVMAPGTSDQRVVPAARREGVSRSANLVTAGGVVAGTWTLRGAQLDIAWFTESGRVPRTALEQATSDLSEFVGQPIEVAVRLDPPQP